MRDMIIKNFDGKEIDPQVETDKMNDFERYLPVLSRTTFNLTPDEPITSEEYQYQLKRYSSQLANNRIIEYQDERGNKLSRHLSREEYDRVSYDRVQNGTGGLQPYNEVKIISFETHNTKPLYQKGA